MKYFAKAFRHYADFKGRASRKEYWMFFLFYWIFLIVVGLILFGITAITDSNTESVVLVFIGLYSLVFFLPSLSIATRRLHDTGRSGWYNLIFLVPFIGAFLLQYKSTIGYNLTHDEFVSQKIFSLLYTIGGIILLVLFCKKGDKFYTDYGPVPNDD